MIHLDYRDNRPIYQQVKDGFRKLMITGVLSAGDKLPSVRALAGELAINPNTIARAYLELEQEGYVVSATGKGSFVAEGHAQHDARKEDLKSQLLSLLTEIKALGMTQEELLELWKGENTNA